MAAELGLVSLNQAKSQHNPTAVVSWMWNPKAEDNDDSWEVRAFAEDTGNIMGTTWPPRSYTCTFCRREFRSAQALGGHMNVHRRDRARLHHHHQTQPAPAPAPPPTTTSSSTQDQFTANAGLCLLYQLPNPNGVFTTSSPITLHSPPSTFLSISPYPPGFNTSSSGPTYSTKAQPSMMTSPDNIGGGSSSSSESELDLELRLGHRPPTS